MGTKGTLTTLHANNLESVAERLLVLGLLGNLTAELTSRLVAQSIDYVVQLGQKQATKGSLRGSVNRSLTPTGLESSEGGNLMRPAMLAGLLSAGVPFPKAIELADPKDLPDKFRDFIVLAFELGAPLVPTLSQLEVQLRHEERTSQEIDQAQAVPQATRTLLIWLPVVSFVLAQIMGLGTFTGILHPVGALAALLAGALLVRGL